MRYCLSMMALLAGLAIAGHGCIIDTVPLPELDGEKDRGPEMVDPARASEQSAIQSDAVFWSHSPAILVGTEWSVPARIQVFVTNLDRSHWQGSTASSINGSFNLPINAGIGDEIELSVISFGVELDSTALRIEPSSVAANLASVDLSFSLGEDSIPGTPPITPIAVSSPDVSGLVTVSGTSATVAYGIAVVVADLSSGTSTATYARSDGSFVARLMGRSGDELSIFAVEPASSNGGSTLIQTFVP